MEITKEFLEKEVHCLELEIQKANVFLAKAQGVIEAYQMLLKRLNTNGEENG